MPNDFMSTLIALRANAWMQESRDAALAQAQAQAQAQGQAKAASSPSPPPKNGPKCINPSARKAGWIPVNCNCNECSALQQAWLQNRRP